MHDFYVIVRFQQNTIILSTVAAYFTYLINIMFPLITFQFVYIIFVILFSSFFIPFHSEFKSKSQPDNIGNNLIFFFYIMPNPLCYLLLFFNFSNCSLVNPLRLHNHHHLEFVLFLYFYTSFNSWNFPKQNTPTQELKKSLLNFFCYFFLIVKRTINLKNISLCFNSDKIQQDYS